MSEKENEKSPDFLEESKNKTDDGTDGDDGGFGAAVLEITMKMNKNDCYEHH